MTDYDLTPTARKYFDLYKSDPLNAKEYADKLRAFIASQTLQREFNETSESFFKRRPDVKMAIDDCNWVINQMNKPDGA